MGETGTGNTTNLQVPLLVRSRVGGSLQYPPRQQRPLRGRGWRGKGAGAGDGNPDGPQLAWEVLGAEPRTITMGRGGKCHRGHGTKQALSGTSLVHPPALIRPKSACLAARTASLSTHPFPLPLRPLFSPAALCGPSAQSGRSAAHPWQIVDQVALAEGRSSGVLASGGRAAADGTVPLALTVRIVEGPGQSPAGASPGTDQEGRVKEQP